MIVYRIFIFFLDHSIKKKSYCFPSTRCVLSIIFFVLCVLLRLSTVRPLGCIFILTVVMAVGAVLKMCEG